MNPLDLENIATRDRLHDPTWAAADRTALLKEVRDLRRVLKAVLDRHDAGYVLGCKACADARPFLRQDVTFRVDAE